MPGNSEHAKALAALFGADHKRLRALWEECSGVSADAPAFRRAFFWFERALRRHMRAEERMLIPAVEDTAGMREWGPLDAIRLEHRRLEEELDKLLMFVLAAEDSDLFLVFENRAADLIKLFETHIAIEERVLYPMADLNVSPRRLKASRAALAPSNRERL